MRTDTEVELLMNVALEYNVNKTREKCLLTSPVPHVVGEWLCINVDTCKKSCKKG